MRFFEKRANPLAWGLSLGARFAGEGAGAWITKTLASKGFQTAAKIFGSQGTIESAARSSIPALSEAATNGALRSSLGTAIGGKLTTVKNLNPGVAQTMRDAFSPTTTMWGKGGYKDQFGFGKGLWQYGKNEILAGKGTGMNAFKASFANDTRFVGEGGKIYERSLAGKVTNRALGVGQDAYYLGDAAFGKLEPGETRTGRVMGNLGSTVGFRSARRGIPGMIRSFGLGYIGQNVGNALGGPPAPNLNNVIN